MTFVSWAWITFPPASQQLPRSGCMNGSTKRRVGMALVTGATAIGLAAGSGPASAGPYDVKTGPKTIKIKLKGKKPFFKFPKQISKGAKLTIVNTTNPKKIGPHTFSLVKPANLPKGKKQRKACFNAGICGPIAVAHKFDPQTEKVNKPNVDAGKKGWDK